MLMAKSVRRFDPALFASPSAEYRGAPLWSWNTKLSKERLLRQIDYFAEMGMGGFHIHSRVGLDTAYLGDEFMDLVVACMEYAKGKQLLTYLYDEDRWPSGCAGGVVTDGFPEFESQHILLTRVKYGMGNIREPPAFLGFAARSERGHMLARYEIHLNPDGHLESSRLLEHDEPEEGLNVYYAYLEPNMPSDWYNGRTYVDTLNPAAIARFIHTTHEKYRSRLGAEFGKAVPSIFTDEPQFASKTKLKSALSKEDIFLPWTFDLVETFQKSYGYNPLQRLPELVWDLPNNAPSTMRYHFQDHVCERFVEAFMDQISNWCRSNGILLIGHMMEEPFLQTQASSLGEAMRCYRNLDMPGVDMLCDQFEFNTVKQASSVARQNGAKGAMSEIYGVSNWTFSFEGHKGSGDWQAALGVVFRVHHLTWVSMAGEGKRDFPACLGYQSPWFREYRAIEDYFSRLHVVLTRGLPLCRVAVIHPIESFWLCCGPADSGKGVPENYEKNHAELTRWLLHGLVDFDFISESLFAGQTKIDRIGKQLPVGSSLYDAVIVPNLWTMRSTTRDALWNFHESEGLVIVLGNFPPLVDGVVPHQGEACENTFGKQVHWSRDAILEVLQPFRDLEIIDSSSGRPTESLLYQMRQDGEERFLFICNTARDQAYTTEVSLKGEWRMVVLDAFTGRDWELSVCHKAGQTVFPYVFEGTSSLLLRMCPGKPSSTGDPQRPLRETYGKFVSEVRLDSVQLSEPNVLVLDYAEWRLDEEKDWWSSEELLRIDNLVRKVLELPMKNDNSRQPWSIPLQDRAPIAKLKLRMNLESEIGVIGAKLALEDPEAVRIFWNGHHLSSMGPNGWWVDEDIRTVSLPPFSAGKHTLELEYDFGLLTNIERIYLLGPFGVDVRGRDVRLVSMNLNKLSFGDWTRQNLPFYAGNVTYECSFTAPSEGQSLALSVPSFVSPLLTVSLDGQASQILAFEPRMLDLGVLEPGQHQLMITCFGNRENSFGTLHLSEGKTTWIGPTEFRTDRPGWWQNEYAIKRMGILATPCIFAEGRDPVLVQPHILRFDYERATQRV